VAVARRKECCRECKNTSYKSSDAALNEPGSRKKTRKKSSAGIQTVGRVQPTRLQRRGGDDGYNESEKNK